MSEFDLIPLETLFDTPKSLMAQISPGARLAVHLALWHGQLNISVPPVEEGDARQMTGYDPLAMTLRFRRLPNLASSIAWHGSRTSTLF